MTDLHQLAQDLRQLAEDVAELRDDVDYLTALNEPTGNGLGTIGASGSGPAHTARAHVWDSLTGREAAAAWTALTSWTDWLRVRYQLEDTLPECWYRHAAIVDELDALRAAWTIAYLNPNAAGGEAANWLEQLGRALPRIRELDRYGCAAGDHREDPPALPDASARDERSVFLHDDVAARAAPHNLAAEAVPGGALGASNACGDVRGDERGDAGGDAAQLR